MTAVIRDELLAVREQRGKLTPQIVVDVARNPEHPLHSRFEWDDTVAGEAYRRQQAQELIRKAKIVYREPEDGSDEPPRLIRAFVAIPTPEGHVYDPIEEVVEDPVRRKIALAEMERDWKELYRRYKDFAEFAGMIRRDLGEAA
jgi:hypothetical protein